MSMKVVVTTLVALFLVSAVAQLVPGGHDMGPGSHGHDGPHNHYQLVTHEVEILLSVNSDMPQDECEAKCDDLFLMLDDDAETETDNACRTECQRQLGSISTSNTSHRPPHDNHFPGPDHHPPVGK